MSEELRCPACGCGGKTTAPLHNGGFIWKCDNCCFQSSTGDVEKALNEAEEARAYRALPDLDLWSECSALGLSDDENDQMNDVMRVAWIIEKARQATPALPWDVVECLTWAAKGCPGLWSGSQMQDKARAILARHEGGGGDGVHNHTDEWRVCPACGGKLPQPQNGIDECDRMRCQYRNYVYRTELLNARSKPALPETMEEWEALLNAFALTPINEVQITETVCAGLMHVRDAIQAEFYRALDKQGE